MSKEDREAIQKTLSLMMDAIQSIKGEMEQRFSYYDEQILNIKSNVVNLEQGYKEIINNSNIQQPIKDSNLQEQMNEMTSKFQLLKSQLDSIVTRSQPESEHLKQKKEQRRVILPKTSSLDSPLKSLSNVKATMGANEIETTIAEERMDITLETKSGIKLTPVTKTTLDVPVDTQITEKEEIVTNEMMNIPPPPSKGAVPTDATTVSKFQSRSQPSKTVPKESKDGKQDDKSELMKALKQLESI